MAKKVKGFGKEIFYTVLFMALFAIAAWYIKQRFFKASFVHYKEFGIDIPTNYSIHGIDVSHYQDDIDWKLVKEMRVKDIYLNFAFLKATEGINNVDENFKDNMEGALEAGIARGAYHFFIASKSGKLQAQNFIDAVNLKKGDLPPVLDVEKTYGASLIDLQDRLADWLTIIEKKYKVKPIIYTSADFYKTYLTGRFDEYPLWVAHYLEKDKPNIKRSWVFWQHSESGHVTGIRTNVDFNVFNGSGYELKNILLK